MSSIVVNSQDQPAPAQTAPDMMEKLAQERLQELPKLRAKLDELRRQNRADLSIVLNESLFNKIFAELTEKKFTAGGLLEVTVINPRISFTNGLALARMQAQLGTATFDVLARLLVEQDERGELIAKLQVMELKPIASSDPGAAALLSAQQLTSLLPPLKLPLQLDFDQTLRPGLVKQSKPIAYEVSGEARRIRGRFEIVELIPLSKRLLMLAKIKNLTVTRGNPEAPKPAHEPVREPARPEPVSVKKLAFNSAQDREDRQQLKKPSEETPPAQTSPAIDSEIDALSEEWRSEKDLSAEIGQRFLSVLTDEFARASTRDLLIKLLPSRVMSSKSDLGFAKYENYLDLDGGDGVVDLRDCDVDSIKNGRITVFVDFGGQIQAQAHGKQIGFSYNANPQIGVNMRDQLSFVVEMAGTDYRLRPVSKQAKIHLDINVPVPALGTGVNASQDLPFDPASVMKPMLLPQVIATGVRLPQSARTINLTNTSYRAEAGRLQFEANIELTEKN